VISPAQYESSCCGDIDAIPNIKHREFLISGICHRCQDSFFGSVSRDVRKAYVTNAVARSIVFYAVTYLNDQGYSPEAIREMRRELSLENLNANHFTVDDLLQSFVNQSAFFLSLYKRLTEGEFYRFAVALEQAGSLSRVFRNYTNLAQLMRHFNRRVFHLSLDCEWMRSDYREDVFHPNTGVFHESLAQSEQDYYAISQDYLIALNMRPCSPCLKSSLLGGL